MDKLTAMDNFSDNAQAADLITKARKLKVLIISLPGLGTGNEPIFPHGIAYLLSALRQDRPVRALHYQRADHVQTQLPEVISKYSPNIVGFTCTTFNRGIVKKACQWLRSSYPEIRIVVGGVHVSFMYEQALRDLGADYVVIGEGDITFRELCNALDNNASLTNVKGIAFLDGDHVVLTPPRETVKNLDDLPMPDYSFAGDLMRKSGMGFVISSRGCPVQCSFCSTSSYWGQRVRTNSPKRVVDKMEALVATYGVKKIFFHDDTFNLGMARVREICTEIMQRGLKIEWGVSCRVNPVSQEMIDMMVAAGCRHICWGIESGSRVMLERIDKKITLEQISNAFALCQKHLGTITVGAFTMVGNPGESAATIDEGTQFINTLQMTDQPSTAILYILPGTKLYANLLVQHPELERYWADSSDIPFYTLENSLEQLSDWARQVSQSGKIVFFDRNKHFWNNVLFGNVPQPTIPDFAFIASELDNLIPPEIKDDEFYELLKNVASREALCTVLEIVSSSGEGSTAALVQGILKNPGRPMLYCLEVSKSRFEQLSGRYAPLPFVSCFNASSISLDQFPTEEQVSDFYRARQTNLNLYPLKTVIGWLQDDIRYVRESGIAQNGIAQIKSAYSINTFDLVLIDGSEFTGAAELNEVIGADWIALDDINAYKNYDSYHRLSSDPDYTIVAENLELRNGYALFRHKQAGLPIHFFTIVLNGMPFITHHIDAFRNLPFRWHWHVVEGVAELAGDTAWSLPSGGVIPARCHEQGLSVDGTSAYIDELKRLYPDNITVYRKPAGKFWHGKLEMVNAPLVNINEPCLLWEIDADECWTHQQLCDAWQMFRNEKQRTAAYYWCHFYVGRELLVSSRNCYSQVAGKEWLRTWRYTPGYRWISHEPPRLVSQEGDGCRDIASIAPFSNDETEARGLVFQHFAYATVDQVRFKEKYYGYSQAVFSWMQLQKETVFPARLADYLPWVPDETTVDTVRSLGVITLPVNADPCEHSRGTYRIVIDGVFFQYYITGVARVWNSLLEELSGSMFASGVVILDRGRTAPRVAGYRYLDLPLHNEMDAVGERKMLQDVCDQHGADLFISTWHTTPVSTPSLLMVHDMLPEILLGDRRLDQARWREKQVAIEVARCFVTVSENTAKDLLKWYPDAAARPVHVMHNGVAASFRPAHPEKIARFRERYGITKPYYLFVGPREWYKNFRLLLEAYLMLPTRSAYCIVSTNGTELEAEFADHPVAGSVIVTGRLTEDELVAAYSGAVALIYPSYYEGFGLPLLEAMACGCPVVTSNAPALVEVGGGAAMHVRPDDVAGLTLAMLQLQDAENRVKQVRLGLERAAVFSWKHSVAQLVRAVVGALGGKMGLENSVLEKKVSR